MSYKRTTITFYFVLVIFVLLSGCSSKENESNAPPKKNRKEGLTIKELKNKSSNKKIDPRIVSLIKQSYGTKFTSSSELIKTKGSQVQVYLLVDSTEESEIENLKNNGVEIEIVNAKLKKIQAWVSLSNIAQISELDNVLGITTPSYGAPYIR